jgi:hypothetical protein
MCREVLFELGVVGTIVSEFSMGYFPDDALCKVTCLEVKGGADILYWQGAEGGGQGNGNAEEETVALSSTVGFFEGWRPGWCALVTGVVVFVLLGSEWFSR